ncbi:Coiled-coil domain-containing protein 90B, mitochondrial [Zostera marina]|uniref:Coiled-coil domain-containing protein 90B, mitochondrial n=1 Tax=Zostera marina TaxID=29655 RepID=A0A0K9P2D1_ZOSMR|nr:Coiled-coil domain-containing protein 90B, mitochondrial [Zostera marina]
MVACGRFGFIRRHTTSGLLFVNQLRQLSRIGTNGNRAFLVDTLALVRRLEAQGIESKHAEAITQALNDSLENVGQSFVAQGEMQKEHHFSLLQLKNDIDKMRSEMTNQNDKMRSEMKYEIDKIVSGQRLDLNLERARTRDELATQNAETNDLTNKLDREIHALRAHLEGAKYDLIKYCIGTLVSVAAVSLGTIRILM